MSNRIDIKQGSMSEVLFEFEQHLEDMPKGSGLHELGESATALDAFKRQCIRIMKGMEHGDEYVAHFGRTTSMLIECNYGDFIITVTW